MPRTVHVRVVTGIGLILHVRGRYRDPARTLLRCLVNLVVGLELPAKLLRHHLRQGCRQSRLAMIYMTNRPHVHVRLRSLKPPLRDGKYLSVKKWEPTSGIEPLTSSLPRTCSTD